ncbi:hypothetical protein Tco_0336540 [Tanacetum coccineum]
MLLATSAMGGSTEETWEEVQDECFDESIPWEPGRCEMVLGMRWLSTLGDINYIFQDLRMSFKYNNKVMTLRGTHKAVVHWMEGKQSKKLLESTSVQCCIMSVCMYPPTLLQLRMEEQLENNSTLSCLISLLQDFKDVFAIPTSLPLNRSHDHRIPLK